MKYIRTKDGIYETGKTIQLEKELQIKRIDDHCFETSWKTRPCKWKQSDTIEELCDVGDLLIVSDGVCKMAIYIESVNYTKCWFRTHDIYSIYEFYIKVGNDYKCVAKMNEKGELELL